MLQDFLKINLHKRTIFFGAIGMNPMQYFLRIEAQEQFSILQPVLFLHPQYQLYC